MTKFEYQFEIGKPNRITFDYSPEGDEQLEIVVEKGEPVLYANRSGMITLAKLLIKMAMGNFEPGFHVHLTRNFNAEEAECMRISLLK